MRVPLAEVVQFNPKPVKGALADAMEVSFVPMAAVEAGSGRMDASTVRQFAEVRKGFTYFADGDVLFAKITPCMENGKSAVAKGLRNGVGFGSTEFHVLRPGERIDARFLYHFVAGASFRREAAHHMTGAVGQKRVPVDFLRQVEIPLPSLQEQGQVVGEIETQFTRLDQAVTNLQRVKANLRRYVSGVLSEAVSGALTASSKANWQTATVADVGDVLLGRRRAPEYATSAHLRSYLRVANIKDDFIAFDDLESMRFDDRHLERYELAPGDILVSEGQSPEKLGQSAIFRGYPQPLCFQSTLHRFRANPALTSPEFAQIVFRSHVRSGVFRKLGSITTNIGHLTLEKFKVAPFPLPPLAEQQQIVAEVERRLSIARGVEAQVEANLKRAQSLRQAVLDKAFAVEA